MAMPMAMPLPLALPLLGKCKGMSCWAAAPVGTCTPSLGRLVASDASEARLSRPLLAEVLLVEVLLLLLLPAGLWRPSSSVAARRLLPQSGVAVLLGTPVCAGEAEPVEPVEPGAEVLWAGAMGPPPRLGNSRGGRPWSLFDIVMLCIGRCAQSSVFDVLHYVNRTIPIDFQSHSIRCI